MSESLPNSKEQTDVQKKHSASASKSSKPEKVGKDGKPKRIVKTKVAARNEKIQGTNDSSIVSKRSVERLYWSKRTPGINGKDLAENERTVEFFRPFVAKPQRRSPTINRGYWTRMEAIMNHIEHTISSTSTKKTVIVGLGAGFDPYPFQYLYNHKNDPNDPEIVFLDVDFPDLITRKSAMIKQAKEITDIIGEPEPIPENLKHAVQLQTKSYIALGCDLTKLDDLSNLLNTMFDLENTLLTFTAEVSITYMPKKEADNVIEWSSKFPHARFVLLEQILPSGPNHPFAKTMLKHFNNLNTPLNSVLTYQQVSDQIERYKSRGWKSVQASSLYQFYEHAITREQKDFLDTVEAFDEWEEFVLFCQHYVILYASTSETDKSTLIPTAPIVSKVNDSASSVNIVPKATEFQYHKKFAAGCQYSDNSVISNGGVLMSRTSDSVLITSEASGKFTASNETFKERMCHELTYIKSSNCVLLTGGRMAPNKPLSDCWKLSDSTWKKVADLPEPRFRHNTIVTKDNNVVLFGGKSSSTDLAWLTYNTESDSWDSLQVGGDKLPNLYSSAVAWNSESSEGYIFGGFTDLNNFNTYVFKFVLNGRSVSVEDISSKFSPFQRLILSRLGAKALFMGDFIYIIGGVRDDSAVDLNLDIVKLNLKTLEVSAMKYNTDISDPSLNLPLYVGFNLGLIGETAVVYGGGAVCFSFGSYWNDVATLGFSKSKPISLLHLVQKSQKLVTSDPLEKKSGPNKKPQKVLPVKEMDFSDIGSSFDQFLKSAYATQKPVAFRNLDLGSSLELWKDPKYLSNSVGSDQKVIVHISEDKNMNFVAKNFDYKNMAFGEFINHVFGNKESAKKVYLRSLSTENPKSSPAIFSKDFPSLAKDFKLPGAFADLEQHQFSSPLRVTSPETAIWLHYDVTANILFQVVGHKTVRLYPPSDVQYLSFPSGSSTSLIDNIFEYPASNFKGPTHPIEIDLGPGDAVFIPACWLHATLSQEPSISVNYFWKDLDSKAYAAGKDVYGNRDLSAYENGRLGVQKLAQTFDEKHPKEVSKFYLQRLAQEILELAENI